MGAPTTYRDLTTIDGQASNLVIQTKKIVDLVKSYGGDSAGVGIETFQTEKGLTDTQCLTWSNCYDLLDFFTTSGNYSDNTRYYSATPTGTTGGVKLRTWGDITLMSGCIVTAKYSTSSSKKVLNSTTGISAAFNDGKVTVSTAMTGTEISFFLSGTTVPSNMFRNCTYLVSVELSPGITEIDSYAFSGCTALTSLTLSKELTNIGTGVFIGVSNLQKLKLNHSYYGIIETALMDYAANITFSGGMASPFYASSNCKIYNEDDEEIINYQVFRNVNAYAFYNCKTLIHVGVVGGTIGKYAFYNNTSINSLTLTSTAYGSIIINSYAFMNCTNVPELFFYDKTEYSIASYAFLGCTSLNELSFNHLDITGSIASYAFSGCTNLKILNLYGGTSYYLTTMPSINQHTFDGVASGGTIKCMAVSGDIPSGYGLTNLNIATKYLYTYYLTKNSGWTVDGCKHITGTYLANSTSMRLCNATYISGLTSGISYYVGTNPISGTTNTCTTTSGYSYELRMFVPSGVTTVPNYCFSDTIRLQSIDLNNLATIGGYAFSGCSSMTGISATSATTINDGGFMGCAFTSLNLNNSMPNLTTIKLKAFQKCTSLTAIYLPSTLTTMSSSSSSYSIFSGCTALTTLYSYATTAPTISSYTFYGISNGGTFHIPKAYYSSYSNKNWLSTGNYYLKSYGWTQAYIS